MVIGDGDVDGRFVFLCEVMKGTASWRCLVVCVGGYMML